MSSVVVSCETTKNNFVPPGFLGYARVGPSSRVPAETPALMASVYAGVTMAG